MRFLVWLVLALVASTVTPAAELPGTYYDESDGTTVVIEKVGDAELKIAGVYNGDDIVLPGRITGEGEFTASGRVGREDEEKVGIRITGTLRGDDIVVRLVIIHADRESDSTFLWRRKVKQLAPVAKPPPEEPPPKRVPDTPPPSSAPHERDASVKAGDEIMLNRSTKAPGLALAFTLPEGFQAFWLDDEPGRGVIVISRQQGRADQDNISVNVSPVDARAKAASADAFYESDEFAAFKQLVNARNAQRVKSSFWDGVVLECAANFSAEHGPKKAEARIWVMIAGDSCVAFKCTVFDWGDLSAAEQSRKDQALQKVFREVLMSVRKTE